MRAIGGAIGRRGGRRADALRPLASLLIVLSCIVLAASPALAAKRQSARQGTKEVAAKSKTKPAAGNEQAPPTAADEEPPKRRPMVSKPTPDEVAAIRAEGRKIAVIETEKGAIRIELMDDEAPLTVANFVKLARVGFYDGLTFHRVVKEPKPFIVQGGDPLGNGMGNPGYTIDGEFSLTKLHIEGSVSMARAADPNSAGSQFFICLAPAPHLDARHALFGQVIEGMSVVHQIVQGDVMKRVTIEWGRP